MLTRSHAMEAFRHLRGHEPDSDDELEAFIDEYVREAYADGVEDWNALANVQPIQRRSMDAPLGKKLQAAGYESLWAYFDSQGFNDIDRFKSDLDSETLAPIGFSSFVIEVASEDANWENAVRVLAANALNSVRMKSKRGSIAFMSVHRIANDSPNEIAWIKSACDDIVRTVQGNDKLLESMVSWDDKWLVELVDSHVSKERRDGT